MIIGILYSVLFLLFSHCIMSLKLSNYRFQFSTHQIDIFSRYSRLYSSFNSDTPSRKRISSTGNSPNDSPIYRRTQPKEDYEVSSKYASGKPASASPIHNTDNDVYKEKSFERTGSYSRPSVNRPRTYNSDGYAYRDNRHFQGKNNGPPPPPSTRLRTLPNSENKYYSRSPSVKSSPQEMDENIESESEDNNWSPRQYTENEREPVYGYYEGDHIYGILPVKLALVSNKRNVSELLIQEGMDINNKKDQKSVSEIFALADSLGIRTREFSKHDLNMLADNRPHQGFILRASPLAFKKVSSLPPSDTFKCVLCLDEVWDPQNLGALLRTSHFLGCDDVVVCAKNSAPLSPSVSKASAGALELMEICSTTNLMRFLDESKKNGWQIIGTALGDSAIDIKQLPLDKPTVVVLGNEGHGIRTNILRRCDALIRIEGGERSGRSDDEVDSLNVSVSGGIVLHHILSSKLTRETMKE